MKNFSIIMWLLFILLLGGCSKELKPENLNEVNVEDLKQSISLALSKKEVKGLLGESNGVAKENSLENIPDNPEYWRYDFPNDGYSFDANTPDDIDIEGLQNGDMKMQLRLSWTSGFFNREVADYSIFYKGDDGLVYWYYSDDTYSVYDPKRDEFIDVQK